jgi:hypothetical protein
MQDFLPNQHDEYGYVERAELLLRQPEQLSELGEMLRKSLLDDHLDKGWLKYTGR